MKERKYDLLTPTEAEEEFGPKFFYRQRIYRLETAGRIKGFNFHGQSCYLGTQIIKAVLEDLTSKILKRYPLLEQEKIQVLFDDKKRVIIIDGIFGLGFAASTDLQSEEDVLAKVGELIEYGRGVENQPDLIDKSKELVDKYVIQDELLQSVLPEEILWVRLDAKELEGVEVRSMILISLSTIAQYVGVRSNALTDWIINTIYSGYILSIHPRLIHGTAKPAPWKKGVQPGYTSFIPFELLPELLVAFKNSRVNVNYPQKAEALYELASDTLKAVGLAASGNKDEAAVVLAEVGEGLGLDVADQIIGVMKQYASRDYQVKTQKEFSGKIKQLNANYAVVTGTLTLGITDKTAAQWRHEGAGAGMKKSKITSAREVMRTISPGDGVGMTFGERHFIKQPNTVEAIKTGREGRSFFKRLQKVGLLEDFNDDKQVEQAKNLK